MTIWFTWPQLIFFYNYWIKFIHFTDLYKALFCEQNQVVRELIFFWWKALICDWVPLIKMLWFFTPTNILFFYYYWIKFIDFVDLNKAMNIGNLSTVRANSLTSPTGVLLTTLRQSPSKFPMRLLFFLMILIQ